MRPFPACPDEAEAEVRNIDAGTFNLGDDGPQNDSFIVQFDD